MRTGRAQREIKRFMRARDYHSHEIINRRRSLLGGYVEYTLHFSRED